jgi:hypothetical protein
MEPLRRQLYADMIHYADLAVVENRDPFYTVQTTFADITFFKPQDPLSLRTWEWPRQGRASSVPRPTTNDNFF